MPHTNELRNFQTIENLRETHEILIFLKLWETQSSFKKFKKISDFFLNRPLKVFKHLKKTPGRLRLLTVGFMTQIVANKYILGFNLYYFPGQFS